MRKSAGYRIRAVDATKYADAIRAFEREFSASLYPSNPKEISECWLVFADGEPVGYAAMEPSVNWPKAGYLSRCGILPEHRGHGLQRRLIRVREAAARRSGWGLLVSDTFQNPHSANNLIACGFTAFEPPKPWAAKNAVYWRKYLT